MAADFFFQHQLLGDLKAPPRSAIHTVCSGSGPDLKGCVRNVHWADSLSKNNNFRFKRSSSLCWSQADRESSHIRKISRYISEWFTFLGFSPNEHGIFFSGIQLWKLIGLLQSFCISGLSILYSQKYPPIRHPVGHRPGSLTAHHQSATHSFSASLHKPCVRGPRAALHF